MIKNKKWDTKKLLLVVIGIAVLLGVGGSFVNNHNEPLEMSKSEAYWKEKLTPQQYYVLRQGGTDHPYTHKEMLNEKRKGTYVTADCGEPVFRSEQKYDSKTGWPSFWAPVNDEALVLKKDSAFGMERVEVVGKKCGTHLGHVFEDGPTVLPDGRKATGKRYCINASALKFIPDKDQ